MTTQKITDSVCGRLAEAFPGWEIYTETVTQGLTAPCFFALTRNLTIERQSCARYRERYPFMIQFIPTDEHPKAQCSDVELQLYRLFDMLAVDSDLYHCVDRSSETTDEVLSFFFVLERFSARQDEADLMQTAQINLEAEYE